MKYAKENLEKPFQYWSRVLFYDETKSELFGTITNQNMLFRKNGQRNNRKNTSTHSQTWRGFNHVL